MIIIERLRKAIAAFREPIKADTFAVIYDHLITSGERYDSEEYYGYFADLAEARRLFTDAFGADDMVHNAFVVKVIEPLKPRREDAP